MNINFDKALFHDAHSKYKNKAQIARVLTEAWVQHNGYCPNCAHYPLTNFANNRPVADFYCDSCHEEYEIKSKHGSMPNMITDGAYDTMIQRIHADNNPNLLFMTYTANAQVSNFLIISKHFFVDNIIIKRKPLSPQAKRAGWTGCNINLAQIPHAGKIFIIKDGIVTDRTTVRQAFEQTKRLGHMPQAAKTWLLEVLACVEKLPTQDFSLGDLYAFVPILQQKYPNNYHIKAKLRQQLQILRDKGFIEFVGRGRYRKLC